MKPVEACALKYREGLFLDTIADLQAREGNPDRYGLIKASGALRLLLLDPEPLVHQVNRDYGVKLVFTFHELPKAGQENTIAGWTRLKRQVTRSDQSKGTTGGLDAFLAAGCLALYGKVLTVREVILTNANVKGGVHAGPPRSEGEHRVLALDQIMNVGGAEGSLASIHDIIRVTLEGLAPLVEAVRSGARQVQE